MSFTSFIFPILTVILGIACYACYRVNKPLRDAAKLAHEAGAKKKLDAAIAEAEEKAREEFREKVAKAVEESLRKLFSEAREYDVRTEENRRETRHRPGYILPMFNRETREVFHKVLRVGALEERVDRIEDGNKVRRDKFLKIAQQVESIQDSIKPYC